MSVNIYNNGQLKPIAGTPGSLINTLLTRVSSLESNLTDAAADIIDLDTRVTELEESGGGGGAAAAVIISAPDFPNQIVTIAGSIKTYTATLSAVGTATVNVGYIDTYTITCDDITKTLEVTTIGAIYNITLEYIATINVSAPEFPNQTVTVTGTSKTYTGTLSSEGTAAIKVAYLDTYTVTCSEISKTVEVDEAGTYNVTIQSTISFAFHYSENDSSPNSVTYPAGYDNSSFTDPFYVNLSSGAPHYGDWDPNGTNGDLVRWLFPKSCMLKYDGTVDYYLNENDETKKADGTTSDVANSSYAGNAMMEWAQDGAIIYWKLIPDSDNKGFTFVVANGPADEDMKPWNHYNSNGTVANHWYTPKYFGSSDGTRLRSISGKTNYVNNNATSEINLAKANNLDSSHPIWYTETYCDWIFMSLLCCLISKSMDGQSKFGKGRCDSSNSNAIGQGTMNSKGLFWGSSNGTSGVKVFGMENPWGNLYRRIAGLINANGTTKIKLTHTTVDGSSANGYNTDGTGYISHGSVGSSGYISHMNVTGKGLTPNTNSGSESTYYCDYCYTNNSQVNYARVGGSWNVGSDVGPFFCSLAVAASSSGSRHGAAPSCHPLT